MVGSKVKNGSLKATDAKGGLPAGPAGLTGEAGPVGDAGVPGSPSSANLTVMSGSVALSTANETFAPSGPSVGDCGRADRDHALAGAADDRAEPERQAG